MKTSATKITVFIVIVIMLAACTAEKRVADGKLHLIKNTITVNGKPNKDEEVADQLYQQANSAIFGFPLRLHLFNLAKTNPDSSFTAKFTNNPKKYDRLKKLLSAKQISRLGNSFWYKGIHEFLKTTGEAPIIIDTSKTKKSLTRLRYHFFNQGYFNANASYYIDTTATKKAAIHYKITKGNAFLMDTIKTTITTPILDSLYKETKLESNLQKGKQYATTDFEAEKNRVTTYFRNHGIYHFQPNYINFTIDTIGTKNKANVGLFISDYSYQSKDSTLTENFKQFKISKIILYPDFSTSSSWEAKDSINYKGVLIKTQNKLKYKPKSLTNALFISKGNLFSDTNTTLTTRYFNNLKIFNYPVVQYEVDKSDPTGHSLLTKIYLSPRKKYSFGTSVDVTHSNIQDFGIAFSPSITIRNVFNSAETLEISARGNIGASKDLANPKDQFFNVSEYGIDLKLNFPRIFLPFSTQKIIPKSMLPSTQIGLGYSQQTNIGLDKENLTGAFTYSWTPSKNNTARFDLFNVQFVRNLNTQNYFNVYSSSYAALNEIGKIYNIKVENFDSPETKNLVIERGTNSFINDVLTNQTSLLSSDNSYKAVKSIEERRQRLTENNFILASSFSFTKTNKKDTADKTFFLLKTKIESAGSLLSLLSNVTKQTKNNQGSYELFNLAYAEYLKTEVDFIKHWSVSREKTIAMRGFFGIAVPFGNSNNVPFSRSYFAGGSNDNRAWQPYSLGPGSSVAKNDFNEANLKIALSTEFRFQLINNFKGALFVDAGNIWNVFDNVKTPEETFKSFKSLQNIAVGSGFGLRYDFSFFVIRFDFGFKTYNPSNSVGKKWFNEYNFSQSVLNFGINYPF